MVFQGGRFKSSNPKFDGVNPTYKRVLWVAIFINAAMFVEEMSAGKLAGSQALQRMPSTFRRCFTYGLSLATIGMSTLNEVKCAAAYPKRLFDLGHKSSYPAQHDNFETSFSNVCAASFNPSTVVRYGKIIAPRSS